MKIRIPDIPEEGLDIDLSEDMTIEGISLVSPVKGRFTVTKSDIEVIVSGDLALEAEHECSRCLKRFRQKSALPVGVVYHPASEVGHERHELHDDEMDMGFYEGEELDLQELITEQVMLNMQMKPLCDEACRGICPKCGIDLNTGSCSCVQNETDPRLEVLKKLLNTGKE